MDRNQITNVFHDQSITEGDILMDVLVPKHNDSENNYYYDGSTATVPVPEETAYDLYSKWYKQITSTLLSCVAYSKIGTLNEYWKLELERCCTTADTLAKHAKCVVTVMDTAQTFTNGNRRRTYMDESSLPTADVGKRNEGKTSKDSLRMKDRRQYVRPRFKKSFPVDIDKIDSLRPPQHLSGKRNRYPLRRSDRLNAARVKERKRYAVKYRQRRSIATRRSYALVADGNKVVTLDLVGRQLVKTLRTFNGHHSTKGWKELMRDFRNVQRKITNDQLIRLRNNVEHHRLSEKNSSIKGGKSASVFAQEEMNKISLILSQLSNQIKELLQTIDMHSDDKRPKKYKFGSPRFFSITPSTESNEVNVLSPSVLSLHDEGSVDERKLSLSHFLESLNGTVPNSWVDFLLELTGISQTIESTSRNLLALVNITKNMYSGVPNTTDSIQNNLESDIERQKRQVFVKLNESFTDEQKQSLNSSGYAFLNHDQLMLVYGPTSPYNDSTHLSLFASLKESEKEKVLEDAIRELAKSTDCCRDGQPQITLQLPTKVIYRRKKRDLQLFPIVALEPVLLRPRLMDFDVLGITVLIVRVMSPFILTPRLLTPSILCPMILSPLIVSPFVLTPRIMCPGTLDPTIVSPSVLSPFIMSPYTLSPLILSPYAFSPRILNPTILSPRILTPALFSPNYFSSMGWTGNILSPAAFSPNINSTVNLLIDILSPSFVI
ncbi:hypothetical protein AB6A40_001768 [Gnathostoma spinigerum]|uniref:Uncharacterized protein n=1 Tax=Gnathostoma spinigerum TaxID=75299 RepID=A0ABD6E4Z0_9BILA